MSREDAYRAVQRCAMAVWNGESGFREALTADAEVGRVLDAAALAALFSLDHYLANTDALFARVFGDDDPRPD